MAPVLLQRGPRDASRITRMTKAGVAFQTVLLCANEKMRIVHCYARFHGLLDQALTRFETIYHGKGDLRCEAIQLFVCSFRTILKN
jgi:hypothetical protein